MLAGERLRRHGPGCLTRADGRVEAPGALDPALEPRGPRARRDVRPRPGAPPWWWPPTATPTASIRPSPTPPRAGRCWSTPARAWWPTAAAGGTAGTEVVAGAGAGDAGGERRGPAPDLHACAATPASGRRPAGRCARATSRRAWSACSWPGRRGAALFRVIRGSEAFERSRQRRASRASWRAIPPARWRSRLTRSDPSILHVLALPFAFVLPRGTPASDQSTAEVASAGPYRIDDYTPGRAIDLVANAGYSAGAAGPAAPGPDAIRRGDRREPGRRRRRGHRLPAAPPHARPGAAATAAGRARAAPRGGHHLLLLHEHAPRPVRRRPGAAGGEPGDRPAGDGAQLRGGGRADRPGAAPRRPRATGGCRSPLPTSPPPAPWWPRRASSATPVTIWGPTNEPAPMVTRQLERTLDPDRPAPPAAPVGALVAAGRAGRPGGRVADRLRALAAGLPRRGRLVPAAAGRRRRCATGPTATTRCWPTPSWTG